MPRVHFVKEGKAVDVAEGANLRETALANGIDLYPFPHHIVNCRGNGLCGSCRVRVDDNASLSERVKAENRKLGTEDAELRLACQCTVKGDIAVITQPRHLAWFDHPTYKVYRDDSTTRPGIPG